MRKRTRKVEDEDVLAEVDGTWRTVSNIRARVRRGEGQNVATSLQRLFRRGAIEQELEPVIGTRIGVYRYRKRARAKL